MSVVRVVAFGEEEGLTIQHHRFEHHRFDSDVIDDTPEAILAQVENYCDAIKYFTHCEIFIRVPLTIERQVKFGGRRVARVMARWTTLKKHEVPASDGPYGL